MKKVKLIPNWKEAWKFASMRLSGLGVILMSVFEAVHQGWIALPSQVEERIPNAALIALVIYILVMIGRIYKLTQRELHADEDNK